MDYWREKKIVRDVLQGRKPTYNHLTEVEIGMLEVFELTKNTKATEEICIDTTKEDFQIYKKGLKKNMLVHLTTTI